MSIFKRSKYYLLICCLFLFQTSMAKAGDWQENLSVDLFLSLDASRSDKDLTVIGGSAPIGLEANKTNFHNSLIGGQLTYQLSDNLSVYVQGSVSNEKQVKSHLDWSYLSYDLGNDLSARVGRFQIPFLQGTELRKVGFSRLWARPLIPGTGAGGFNQYEGIELVKKVMKGDVLWEFQGAFGKAKHGLEEVRNKSINLFSASYQSESFLFRTAVMNGDYSVFTPAKVVITDSGSVTMVSVESEFNQDNWIANVGYSTSDSDITPDDTMHYVSLAYQVGDVTPFIFFSKREQHFERFEIPRANIDVNSTRPPRLANKLPPPPDGDSNSYSSALGVRWDFTDRLALKFQVEKLRVQDQARLGGANISNAGNTLSVVLEGVF